MKNKIINYVDLVKLNNKARKNNKNCYIAEPVMKAIFNKIVVVTLSFFHTKYENRIMIYAGERYPNLYLDIDLQDIDKIKTLELNGAS